METFQYCRQSLKLQTDPVKTRRCIFINSFIGTVVIILLGIVLMNLKFTLYTSLLLSIPLGIVSFMTIVIQQYSNRRTESKKRDKIYEKNIQELKLIHPEMSDEARNQLAELKSLAT